MARCNYMLYFQEKGGQMRRVGRKKQRYASLPEARKAMNRLAKQTKFKTGMRLGDEFVVLQTCGQEAMGYYCRKSNGKMRCTTRGWSRRNLRGVRRKKRGR